MHGLVAAQVTGHLHDDMYVVMEHYADGKL